jgi:hypothetical protein
MPPMFISNNLGILQRTVLSERALDEARTDTEFRTCEGQVLVLTIL